MIHDDSWLWPSEWVGRFDTVVNLFVPNLISDVEDKIVWVNKQGKVVDFSVKEVWNVLNNDSPQVIWYEHLWCNQCIPRQSCILLVAIRGRLKTKDRLTKWFDVQNKMCHLCQTEDESHYHLFFACSYSRRLWERLKPLAGLDIISNDWPSIISGVVSFPAKNKIWSIIQRLVFGAAVYFTWQERNIRRMQAVERNTKCLFKLVFESVRLKLMGLSFKYTSDVMKAAKIWNFPNGKTDVYRNLVQDLCENGD